MHISTLSKEPARSDFGTIRNNEGEKTEKEKTKIKIRKKTLKLNSEKKLNFDKRTSEIMNIENVPWITVKVWKKCICVKVFPLESANERCGFQSVSAGHKSDAWFILWNVLWEWIRVKTPFCTYKSKGKTFKIKIVISKVHDIIII